MLALGHEHIGTERILLGLLLDGEGMAVRILQGLGADPVSIREKLVRLMAGPRGQERVRTYTDEGHPAADPAYLERVDIVLDLLAPQIRSELGRDPDSGDLLLVLALAQDTVAARTLQEMAPAPRRRMRPAQMPEVDLDAPGEAIERARTHLVSQRKQLQQRVKETSRAKHQAIDAKDFVQAERMRDQERDLLRKQGRVGTDLFEAVRQRLGIHDQPEIWTMPRKRTHQR
jgi:ATP-dependent Clp protease ATP-binding subunit ClpA